MNVFIINIYVNTLSLKACANSFASRALCLLALRRPIACIADCDAALTINPDSAKAHKIRGKALRYLGRWEEAEKALAQAQVIDFDESIVPMEKVSQNFLLLLSQNSTNICRCVFF